MTELESRIAGLGLMTAAQLRTEWQRLHGWAPPKGLGPSLMSRGIAYKLQEQADGGMPPSLRRELARLAVQLERSGDLDIERQLRLKTGTRLVREWHGRTCHVTVIEQGYLFEDRCYASLTQIARHVTGAKWSGPRFFGLRQRSRAVGAGDAHA